MTPPSDYVTGLVVIFSNPLEAESSIPWTSRLASQMHLPLTLTYLIDTSRSPNSVSTDFDQVIARDYLHLLASDHRLARIEVKYELVVGSAATNVTRLAGFLPGTLLILPQVLSAGSPEDHATPTDDIIRGLETPFIVMPSRDPGDGQIKSVVVGNDHSNLAQAVLRASQTLGHSMDVAVVEVEAVEPADFPLESLLHLEPILQPTRVRLRGPASRILVATARARGATLIVVGSHGSGDAQGSALGRTSSWLARHADLPVLVVPARRQSPPHAGQEDK